MIRTFKVRDLLVTVLPGKVRQPWYCSARSLCLIPSATGEQPADCGAISSCGTPSQLDPSDICCTSPSDIEPSDICCTSPSDIEPSDICCTSPSDIEPSDICCTSPSDIEPSDICCTQPSDIEPSDICCTQPSDIEGSDICCDTPSDINESDICCDTPSAWPPVDQDFFARNACFSGSTIAADIAQLNDFAALKEQLNRALAEVDAFAEAQKADAHLPGLPQTDRGLARLEEELRAALAEVRQERKKRG